MLKTIINFYQLIRLLPIKNRLDFSLFTHFKLRDHIFGKFLYYTTVCIHSTRFKALKMLKESKMFPHGIDHRIGNGEKQTIAVFAACIKLW